MATDTCPDCEAELCPCCGGGLKERRLVYFIRCGDYVKIGMTTSIDKRLSSLQTGAPEALCMLGVMNGDVNSERLLHEKFAHLRHRGEWFRLDVELEAYIASEAHSLEFGRAYLRQDQIQMQYHGRLEMMRRNALAHGRATRGHERRRSRQPRNALQLSLFET